jgi:hypothetical protein
MKMRIAFLIGFLVGAWGCGKADSITGPKTATPVPPPVTPIVTPVKLGPTPTPHCANFKLCDGYSNGV